MVGYAGPCPCCSGVKRLRAEMGSSESFPSPGSLPESAPAKIPRFSSDASATSSAAATLAFTEQEEQAAAPAPAVIGPEQEAVANDEASSTDAAAGVEAVMAAAVLAVKPMAEKAEQAGEPAPAALVPEQEPEAKASLEVATGEEEQPASAALVQEQEPQARASLEAATGEEELAADEAEKADETAAAALPEQEPETKGSPEVAAYEEEEKQEPEDKASPEAATSEKEEKQKAKSTPLLALSDSDHGYLTQQGLEASSPAGKASDENGVVEKAASPAPAKARQRLTAEVRMSKGVHVDISFRCKCGGASRDVAIA